MTGTLWFDNNPKKSASQKIAEGITFYEAKYGFVATTCYCHPETPDLPGEVGGVKVDVTRSVRPNHFLIGK
jgi:hypothetical protein